MIRTLRHEVRIDASPEAVYAFFENLEANYTRWHPDHIVFRWTKGSGLEEGAVAYSEQRVHGKVHKLSAEFTEVLPGRRVVFRWVNPLARLFAPRNIWIFEPDHGGCRFRAEGEVRLGWISSRLKRTEEALAAGLRHLAEEGENLKRLVEADASAAE